MTGSLPAGDDFDAEALNDRLARAHSIDDYYARSPWIIRWIEQRRLAIIKEFMGDVRGLAIAEVGAGGGHVLRMFPEGKLTAIDVSGVFLEMARKNLAGYDVRFVKGEVDKMDLPPASYDRVVCTEVLEHTRSPEAILAAISRMLRPDGVAVITVPNDPLIMRLKKVVRVPLGWWLGDRIDWGGDEHHLHRWTPDEFGRVLGRHLKVTKRQGAPLDALPIRACFRCVRAGQ
jgi:SAM-dependent methyltransferase